MEGAPLEFGDSSSLTAATTQNPQSDGASFGVVGDEISQSNPHQIIDSAIHN